MLTESEWTHYLLHTLRLCDKILHHPNFASVSASDIALSAMKLSEVLPKVEKLEDLLMQQYIHEYRQHIEQVNFYLFCFVYELVEKGCLDS
jgi:hypothetical protein